MAGAVEAARFHERPGDAAGDRCTLVHVLGVDYLHTRTPEGGDLYLTAHGEPLARHLQPGRWFEKVWFRGTRCQLTGTCSVYAVPTRPVDGESLAIVVKYNRIGMRVPIQTNALGGEAADLEFNGPFEEFALVHDLRGELRGHRTRRSRDRVRTQLPLAIYVPQERWQPEQLQRYEWRVANKVAQHPSVALDVMREYLLVYSYIPGLDAYEAFQQGLLHEDELHGVNSHAERALEINGFRVLDMKPEHVIVQPGPGGQLLREEGALQYGVVDYELMERTADYSRDILSRRRAFFQLWRSGSGAAPAAGSAGRSLPSGLQRATCLGVDFIHGRAESTGGMLWIVGAAPELFDFFLPERWRTTLQRRFLDTHDTYLTTSKDDVRVVWKICRVGELGEMAAYGPDGFRALAYGFNSPFEEFALALSLRAHGVKVISPLAVYRTGHRSGLSESRFDLSRYESHREFMAQDGGRALDEQHSYITIWEHWSGPHCGEPSIDRPPTHSLNVRQAAEDGPLCEAEASWLVAEMRQRLEGLGVAVIRLEASHLLVALDPCGAVVRNRAGEPEVCLCNLQHLSWPSQIWHGYEPGAEAGPGGNHDEPVQAPGSVER